MPTQYAVVSVAEPERHVSVFSTGSEAGQSAAYLNEVARQANVAQRYRVLTIDIAGDGTEPDWRQREQARFDNGTYTAVPWADEPWAIHDHYAHVAVGNPQMVAFTPDGAHGEQDRQTWMLPGRYLERYHGEHESAELATSDIRSWSTRWAIAHEDLAVQFATTEDEIQRVYLNGPRSCMSYVAREYATEGYHPVRVYAGGDLAIAYLEQDGGISSRAICWPERRVYGRVYDGAEGRLPALLEAQGYRPGDNSTDWEGARLLLRRIGNLHRLVVPYLDIPPGRLAVDLEAGLMRIDRHGPVYGTSTRGCVMYQFPVSPAEAEATAAALAADFATEGLAARNYYNRLVDQAHAWNIRTMMVNGAIRQVQHRTTAPTGQTGYNMITALRARLQAETRRRT